MKNILWALWAFAFFMLAVLPVGAIELSLEENRAQRGSVGYIDMQRLFKTFPETVRAKENFDELVRQAEEQLNIRKAEILRQRNDLSQLKIQREFIARTPIEVPAPPMQAPPAATTPQAPPAPVQPPAPSKPSISTLPGFGGTTAPAPAPAQPESLALNIPGVSTGPIVVGPPAGTQPAPQAPAPSAVAVSPSPAVAVSTSAVSPLVPSGSTTTVTSADGPAAVQPLNPALVEIDAKIALRAKELAEKERDYKKHQADAEKNLLDIESRRTEILLGKIHRVVQDIARQEGVSVVVDKTSILYGHDAVDLTEKVMKKLKGT